MRHRCAKVLDKWQWTIVIYDATTELLNFRFINK